MSDDSKIEWTDATWPITVGCTRTAPAGSQQSGCGDASGGGCYAENLFVPAGVAEDVANQIAAIGSVTLPTPDRAEEPIAARQSALAAASLLRHIAAVGLAQGAGQSPNKLECIDTARRLEVSHPIKAVALTPASSAAARLAEAKRLGMEACALADSAIDNSPDPASIDVADQAAIAAGHQRASEIRAALEDL